MGEGLLVFGMNKFLVTFIFLFSFSSYGNLNCFISSYQKERLLNLSFDQFDQNINNGWRVIERKGCQKEAIYLIELYTDIHKKDLLEWQNNILIWHAGQIYGFMGDYQEAIIRFRKNINPNELPSDTFKWNAYVKGSIAFLEKDLHSLQKAINDLEKATNSHSIINLKILKSFERCFNKTYSEACTPNCNMK